jgi:mercuric ion binding protein
MLLSPLIRRTLVAVALAACMPAALAATRQVTLTVPTMDCATCPVTIRVALLKVPGVSRAQVSYTHRNARITFDDSKTSVAELTRATESVGYPSFLADGQ